VTTPNDGSVTEVWRNSRDSFFHPIEEHRNLPFPFDVGWIARRRSKPQLTTESGSVRPWTTRKRVRDSREHVIVVRLPWNREAVRRVDAVSDAPQSRI